MTVPKHFNFTKDEKEAVEELRKRIGDELLFLKRYDETTTMYRFLKARDWDINYAEEMLRKAIEWRRENGTNTLVTDFKPPEVLKKYFENVLIAHDKEEKCPVYYLAIGKLDIPGIFKTVKVSDFFKFLLQFIEEAENYLEVNCTKLNSGFIYILDQSGLPFSTATNKKAIEMMIKFFKVQQDIYPERLKKIYIINASPIFTFPFNIIKSFMAPRVLGKIQVYGTEGYQDDLLKVLDADDLPAFLGGERTDPGGDPLCKTIVQQAGKINEKYYMPASKSLVASSSGMKKVVVARASFLEMPLHIQDPGSLIEWEFGTKTRDIGFGLFYKEKGSEENLVQLVALQRLDTEEFSETGMYKCDKAGVYVILFDNSYSWVRSKEIYYKITVVNPKEHENRMSMG